ncbi:MAG TPA: CHAD domain-containing protein [Polyangiaceae bacterium]|nr:CHAD domain-containing protein [Polyangiaceae bacterium]
MTGELDGALEWLGGTDRALDPRVHEARKHLKRLRAVLALGRSAIESGSLDEQAQAARAAATELSALRGQAALLTCFDALLERAPPDVCAPDAMQRVRAALSPIADSARDLEAPLEQARAILLRARARANQLEVVAGLTGWDAWSPGFRSTYRAARRALTHALRYPSARQLHAFRTAEKRHLYQVELLEPIWEGPLRAQREELAELGELLGDHHDLALLSRELERHPDLQEELSALKPVIQHRLAKLERAAVGLGARAFAEKSAAIARRFGEYFRAAFA